MGVPKFFRYISERYPCLSELLRENQVPEFDNLYLDMNGIIHNCSHPNDADVTFRISEQMIFEGVFHYVEYLFKMIRPQKLFFIAVDGVAPRAKMNQQRGRRFRSANEAQMQLEKAIEKGEEIPSEDRFDSNCITPGTAFMVRLQIALEHFIQVKIATDVLWKACTVILSGHETPGEGEHKIMEYIRHAKAQPGFNPNTRHCLYGLDADLIMLGLCTHERYFSLLREEVNFGKNDKKITILKDIRFYLLHLTLLSEYLELEFASIRDKLRFQFDIHKLIDDWILLVYLVGNDFIPHLPHLHINENALPTLYKAYMQVLPKMDGYINEAGILNLPRLQILLRELSSFDRDTFLEHYTDLKYLEGKCGKDNLEAFDVTADEIMGSSGADKDLLALIMSSEMLDSDGEDGEPVASLDDIENDPELFEKEFQAHKRNYYMTKMGYADFTEEVRAEQAECYIRALQWTLHYYYRGVVSWSWYYPHHYAPFISDIDHFADLKLEFEMARPFLPFQQLLSVLPAGSKSHLPVAYHQLMTDPESPVYDFYPPEFSTDLNGKQQSWEAVVLIPFIEEKRLLKAMHVCDAFLTDEEKQRNVHGPMLQYQYDAKQNQPLEAKYGFPAIEKLPVRKDDIFRDDLAVEENKLVLGPSKGAILDGYAKGFPTFKQLEYHGVLKEAHVKIFNFPSKNDSMVIFLDNPAEQTAPDTAELAKKLLGTIVYVSWPHLLEAKVVRVADSKTTYDLGGTVTKYTDDRSFNSSCRSIIEHNQNRLALNVGPLKQLVFVRTCVGTAYMLEGNTFVLKKLWNEIDTAYPAQTIICDLQDVMQQQKPYLELREMLLPDSTVFLRSTQSYGSMGHVVDFSSTSVKVRVLVHEEPDLERVLEVHKRSLMNYRSANDTASSLGISYGLLMQLCGTILVAYGGHRSLNVDDEKAVNIGLRLRMLARDEEAVGYCRKSNKTWLYSDKTVQLLEAYADRAPGLFEKLEATGYSKVRFETDLFGEGNEGKLKELVDWLKLQEHNSAERRSCGITLLEEQAVSTLTKLIDQHREKQKPVLQTMLVDPTHLYRPGMKKAKTIDDQVDFDLLDRVVVVQPAEDAPVGWRGTIIGVHRVTDPNPVRREALGQVDSYFEILFDEPFHKGLNIFNLPATEKRVLRLAQCALLNISAGRAYHGHRYKVPLEAGATANEKSGKTTPNGGPPQSWRNQNPAAISTAESLQRRVSERIDKRNNVWRTPNTASIDTTVPLIPPTGGPSSSAQPQNLRDGDASKDKKEQQNNEDQLRKVEFERLWKKLKESSKDAVKNSLFDENDIKSFAQAIRGPAGGDKRGPDSQPSSVCENVGNDEEIGANPETNVGQKPSIATVEGDNLTGLLKQMLRIYGEPASADSQFEASQSKLELMVPAPASLPKPPIQWQRKDDKSSHPVSSVEVTQMHQEGLPGRGFPANDRVNPSAFIAQFANVPHQPMPPPMMFQNPAPVLMHPQLPQGGAIQFSMRPAMMCPPRNAFIQQQQARYGPPAMQQQPEVVPPVTPFGAFQKPPQLHLEQPFVAPFAGFQKSNPQLPLQQQQPSHHGPPPPIQQRKEVVQPMPPFNVFRRQQQQPPKVQEVPSTTMIVPQQCSSGLGPKGPQNLSYNRNNPAGNGAFVPLQAMKQNAKSKPAGSGSHKNNKSGNTNNGSITTGNHVSVNNPAHNSNSVQPRNHQVGNSFHEKNARERQVVVKRQAEAEKGFAKFLSTDSADPQASEADERVQPSSKPQKREMVRKPQQSTATNKLLAPLTMEKDASGDEPIVVKKKVPPKQKNRIAARFGSALDG